MVAQRQTLAVAAPEIRYEQFRMSNGLQVILHEDHKLPIVAVNIWYHVGPASERAGRTGFAHLFEHMMLQGSRNLGEQTQVPFLESVGATDINATTSFDRTNYFETVPSNQLETTLWMESDRMGFLLDTLSRERLVNQRDVVRNERRRWEDSPYGVVDEELYHQLFPKGHPYHADVMGSHADIEAARLADVRQFFRDFYAPNNATLVLAGDFDPAAARALVEKYFGPLPVGPAVASAFVATPPITTERRAVVTDTEQYPKVILGWLVPSAFKSGDAEAEIAARILGGGDSSRLYRELVLNQRLAQSASCEHTSLALASTFSCELVANDGVTAEKLEADAEKIIARFQQDGPTTAELEQARNTILTKLASGSEDLGDGNSHGELTQLANTLNRYNQYTGDPGYLPRDVARYEAVTAKSVRALAAATLGQNQRVVIHGIPGKKILFDVPRSPDDTDANVKVVPSHLAEFYAAQAWRATRPKPGAEPALKLPQPQILTLENGLTIYLVERHDRPVVAMQLLTLAGTGANPVHRAGLACLTATLLTEGTSTSTRTSERIASEAALLGSELESSCDANAASLGMTLLTPHAGAGMELIADVAMQPRLATKDLEQLLYERKNKLLSLQNSPRATANRTALLALYGPESPYGYDQLGTEKSLNGLTREEVSGFYANHYGPRTSMLALAGDLTAADAGKLAQKVFGKWSSMARPQPVLAVPAETARRVLIIDRPGAPQTTLQALASGQAREADDYPEAAVMIAALGGQFSSRIYTNLREVHGYAYWTSTGFRFQRGGGPFSFRAQVRADVTAPAIEQFFAEMEGIHTNPLTAVELSNAKNSLVRSLLANFESNNSTIDQLATLWLYHLSADDLSKLPERIQAVDAAGAQRAGERYIHAKNTLLVVVGDKNKFETALRALKLGPVAVATSNKEQEKSDK
jgi:zinc protease